MLTKRCTNRNKTDRRRPHDPGDTEHTKTGRKCGQVQPRTAFARDGDRRDRRRSYCKQCECVYARAYQARKRAARANALVALRRDEHALG